MVRTFLTLAAIADLAYGAIVVAAPEQFLAVYGRSTDATGVYALRFLGGALVGFGVIFWLARDVLDVRALRMVVLGLLVASTIGFVVSLLDQLAGNSNPLGWSTVVLTLVFAAGSGYFAFASRVGQG